MSYSEIGRIKKHLLGLKLIDAESKGDELHLTFTSDLTLIITGDYSKNVYCEIKQRKVIYEDVSD